MGVKVNNRLNNARKVLTNKNFRGTSVWGASYSMLFVRSRSEGRRKRENGKRDPGGASGERKNRTPLKPHKTAAVCCSQNTISVTDRHLWGVPVPHPERNERLRVLVSKCRTSMHLPEVIELDTLKNEPVQVAAIVTAVTTIIMAFGFHVDQRIVGAVVTVLVVVFGIVVRANVTPVDKLKRLFGIDANHPAFTINPDDSITLGPVTVGEPQPSSTPVDSTTTPEPAPAEPIITGPGTIVPEDGAAGGGAGGVVDAPESPDIAAAATVVDTGNEDLTDEEKAAAGAQDAPTAGATTPVPDPRTDSVPTGEPATEPAPAEPVPAQ